MSQTPVAPPKLRGWFHLGATPAVIIASLVLFVLSKSSLKFAVAIYSITAIMLFSVSAIYHRVPWVPEKKKIWRRWDHANINLLIAGSYTPFAVALLEGRDRTILLQHRAPWVHNGDTWGIPGGARDSHETPTEAALREAHEEIGIAVNLVDPIEIYSDQHDGWSNDTVISKAHKDLIAHEQNDESLQVEWVAFEDVVDKNLHPSFAKTWPVLLARLEIIFI
jgi:8-oxo-dGTP pyrophosphatase MutT (NUDIX family)